MAEISAALVKELREKTGAGMMDCKKALAESGGALEAAVDWLRKKGLAAAAKRAGREASEGLVGVVERGKAGALVELNCETDFVARNAMFQDAVAKLAELAFATGGDVERLKAAAYPGEKHSVAEHVTQLVATIGENIQLRRAARLEVAKGVVSSYVHNATKPGMGRIGVLVALESDADPAKLNELGHQIAMHVAAANPSALSRAEVDLAALERERAILAEQARVSGKPEEIVNKMVEGRLKKFYEEVVLTEQVFVIDGKSKVGALLEEWGRRNGAAVRIAAFRRFALGEGAHEAGA